MVVHVDGCPVDGCPLMGCCSLGGVSVCPSGKGLGH